MVSELVNPAAVIEWNLDKTYLRQLEASEVPIIPTTWVMPDDDWQPPDRGEFVIKPSVSAGGRNTAALFRRSFQCTPARPRVATSRADSHGAGVPLGDR